MRRNDREITNIKEAGLWLDSVQYQQFTEKFYWFINFKYRRRIISFLESLKRHQICLSDTAKHVYEEEWQKFILKRQRLSLNKYLESTKINHVQHQRNRDGSVKINPIVSVAKLRDSFILQMLREKDLKDFPPEIIYIDTMQTDEILIENFKKYINQIKYRKKNVPSYYRKYFTAGRENIFSQKDLEKWHKHNVLAYLDLMAWWLKNDITFTDEEAAEILDCDVDMLKKTTKPLSGYVLTSYFFFSLETQVNQELLSEVK